MLWALLTLLFAGIALYMAFHVSSEVRRCRDWPTVQGTILERGVGEPMGTSRGRSFLPKVVYTYTVGGTAYTNDQVYLIRRTGGPADDMQKLVDGLPNPVPVHYNPQDPAKSWLLMNSMSTFWLLLTFGIVTLLIGLLQAYVTWSKGRIA